MNDLTEKDFDDYIQTHPEVMVDFVQESDKQTKELLELRAVFKTYDIDVPFARVNVDQWPALAKRYFRGCDEERELCADSFPRLRWFVNGNASQYHRSLSTVQDIFSFTVALNRDYVRTVSDVSELQEFNRYLLFNGDRSSPMYTTLERLASRHMDTLAVAHVQQVGSNKASWFVNQTVVEEYTGDDDEEAVEGWLRQHFIFGEEPPEEPVDEDPVSSHSHSSHIVLA